MTGSQFERLLPTDPRLAWKGAIELDWEPGVDAWRVWRVPQVAARGTGSDLLTERARTPAGVRLDVEIDADALRVVLRASSGSSPVDVRVDGVLVARSHPDQYGRVSVPLDPGPHGVEVWLPQFGSTAVAAVEIAGLRSIRPATSPNPRWIAYGSSIIQGRTAAGPSETWTAITARERSWDVLSLGMGGECHLDIALARFIRDTPADLISLCVGINIYGHDTFTARSLPSALAGFVQIVREGHPNTPMTIISPLVSAERENLPNRVGLTLADVRDIVFETTERLNAITDDRIAYLDGSSVFGFDDQHLLVDGLHPGPEGHEVLGRRFAAALFPA